jgi:hypothetical protein
VNKELLALIKKAVSKISEQQGVPLADLRMDLDAMEEADVLRLAETFLSADDLAL